MKGTIKSPESRFLKVECKGCGNTQVIFDRTSSKVKCLVCDAVLADPTGGKADVKVPISRTF